MATPQDIALWTAKQMSAGVPADKINEALVKAGHLPDPARAPVNPLQGQPVPQVPSMLPKVNVALASPQAQSEAQRNTVINRGIAGLTAIPASMAGAASAMGLMDVASGANSQARTLLSAVPGVSDHPIQQQIEAVPQMVQERQQMTFPERMIEGGKALYGGMKQAVGQPFGGNVPRELLEMPVSPETSLRIMASNVAGGEQLTAGAVGLPLGMVKQEALHPGSAMTAMPAEFAMTAMPLLKGAGMGLRAAEVAGAAKPGVTGALARGAGRVAGLIEEPGKAAYGAMERVASEIPDSVAKSRAADYIEAGIKAGRWTADKGAQMLEKIAPHEYKTLIETTSPQTPSLLARAAHMAWNATKGAAIGGAVVGDLPAAAIGAMLPESMRAIWGRIPPERQAQIARNLGTNPATQATQQETAIAEIPHSVSQRARGIQEIGREAGGIVKSDMPDLVAPPEPVMGRNGRPINPEYYEATVHRPGEMRLAAEQTDEGIRPSRDAGARLVDVGKSAEDLRGTEYAAGKVKDMIPDMYRELTQDARKHADQLREARQEAWTSLDEKLSEMRQKRAEIAEAKTPVHDDYRAAQDEIGRLYEVERKSRTEDLPARTEKDRAKIEREFADDKSFHNYAARDVAKRMAEHTEGLNKAFDDAGEQAKQRHAEYEAELDASHQTLHERMAEEKNLRRMIAKDPLFKGDPQLGSTLAAIDKRIADTKAQIDESAQLRKYAVSEHRGELRALESRRREELRGNAPEGAQEQPGEIFPASLQLRETQRAQETINPNIPRIMAKRQQALQSLRERTAMMRQGLEQMRQLLKAHSENAKAEKMRGLADIDAEHAGELNRLADERQLRSEEFGAAKQEHQASVDKLRMLQSEGRSELDSATTVKKMARGELRDQGLLTDQQMKAKAGLEVPTEPTRVPFKATSERLNEFNKDVAGYINELGGLPSTDLPEKMVARLTTDPLLRDSLSVLRSPRYVGLLLDKFPEAKTAATKYIYDELSRTALGDEPKTAVVKLADGKTLDLKAESIALWDKLKRDDPKMLAEMQAEAIKANFKQASTLSVEQGIGMALYNEATRFHGEDTLGREGSLPAYASTVARRVLGESEATPQVLTFDPSTLAAQMDKLAQDQGLSADKAKALGKALESQYEPMPADMKAMMNEQARKAGKPELAGAVYIKKGYKETVRAVGDAEGVFRQMSEANTAMGKAFYAAKKGVTALSHGVHVTNTMGNMAFRWMQDGTDPVSQIREMRRAYGDWKGFKDGTLRNAADAAMMRSFAKSGYLHTGLLDFEADALSFGKTPAQGKFKQAWQHYDKSMTAAYSLGDSLFKIAQGEKNYRTAMSALDRLGKGNSITLELGKGREIAITALGDGKFKVGNKTLAKSAPEISDLVAVHALEKPTRWLLDYSQQPILFQQTRRALLPQAVGALNPFMSWGYGMLDLPWKKGAIRNLLDYDGSMFKTNDPALLLDQAKRALVVAAKRAAMTGAAESQDDQRRASRGKVGSKMNPNPTAVAEPAAGGAASIRYLDAGNPFGPAESLFSFLLQQAASHGSQSEMAKAMKGGDSVPIDKQTPEQRAASNLYLKAKGQQLFSTSDQLAKVNNIFFGVAKHLVDDKNYSPTAALIDATKTFAGATAALLPDTAMQVATLIDPTAHMGSRRVVPDPMTQLHRVEPFIDFWMRQALTMSSRSVNPYETGKKTMQDIRGEFQKSVLDPLKRESEIALQQGTKEQFADRLSQWTKATVVLNTYLAHYGLDALPLPGKEDDK